ncbi:GatB/YqeY domain-containing protein [Nonlabens ponticola]|uniref:GatB/YqeY domain-containing protein n=1 Tax=Nonlabens ponticola TaxID=2496866 RepID=A0A3S9N0L3_9FLAO|nr:GatB/YqeY domain-containing protein [Nonlabens ponticola]AZQ45076.1 GatB/YqeY domain-containing protein [Nonlabens ponticola]
MSLEKKVMTALKEAMKSKDQVALASLRAVKSELLLAKTSGDAAELSEEQEIKLVQKLVKQRKDSARIFTEQDRNDLAEPELAQAAVLEQFLPEQMSEDEIATVVQQVIDETGANGMKDMGKVMGRANQLLAGKADGRTISTIVKQKLNS